MPNRKAKQQMRAVKRTLAQARDGANSKAILAQEGARLRAKALANDNATDESIRSQLRPPTAKQRKKAGKQISKTNVLVRSQI
jgi:hypothetical protein